MARARDGAGRGAGREPSGGPVPRGRFSKSGHTSHPPGHVPPAAPEPGPDRRPGPPDPQRRPAYGSGPGGEGFGAPTYHHSAAEQHAAEYRASEYRASEWAPDGRRRRSKSAVAGSAAVGAARQTNRAARYVTRKVISASKADGADESGLTALIWNQVLSYGADAMITVALASTVFFGASTTAQRGNVLLYLLITMAPFAVIAPVIGPVLDLFPHARRWVMAGTAAGRAVLALIMAAHSTELLVLYPCALGSLVLSKAYGVVRASAAPRLVPRGLTLTEVNARLSIFGLGSGLVLGALVGGLIKASGSYSLGLVVCALGFAACAVFAVRLPRQVDSAAARATAGPALEAPAADPQRAAAAGSGGTAATRYRTAAPRGGAALGRLLHWARRGYDDNLVTALQGQSALRLLYGMLTIYLALYVESTAHGMKAAAELGAVVVAAGAGNALGTALGARIRLARPDLVVIWGTVAAAVDCLLAAIMFDIGVAVVGMLVAAFCNALCKIAIDSMIQRDVPERLRSSAFGRSETFLQLAWVVGAAIGVGLPVRWHTGGALVFWVGLVIVGATAVIVTLRHRVVAARGR